MKIQESSRILTLEFTNSKWDWIGGISITVFSLSLFLSFSYGVSLKGWDLTQIEWLDESGKSGGPVCNVILSLLFFGMSLVFSVMGIIVIIRSVLNPRSRITIDRFENGFVREIKNRRWRRDTEQSWSKSEVLRLELKKNSDEGPDKLDLILVGDSLKLTEGGFDEITIIADQINQYLSVEIETVGA